MILRFIKKLILSLGLLLFFTLLIPQGPDYVRVVQAAGNLDKENKVPDYRLNLKNITLVINKSFTLKAYNLSENSKVSFKSNDSEIASVNDEGTITANKVGSTAITVTIKDGNNSFPLTCEVTVGPPAFSVRFTKSRIILGLDKSDLLKVILKPTNTAEVAKFSTYNEEIATISPGGKVTAKKLGLTYLFALIDTKEAIGFNKFATCTLIVTNPEDVTPLETYFNEHPELDQLPASALYDALIEFFNGTSDKEAIASSISAGSVVENFDKFLNEKFDLKIKSDEEASIQTGNNKPEVVSDRNAQ